MTSLLPPGLPRSFVIPLGVMDVRVLVDNSGEVTITSPSPVPHALESVVTLVLETWMIDLPAGWQAGETMIPPEAWFDYFGHRTVAATDG